MSRHHRRKQRFKLRSFYVWHRYMGLSVAIFALLVAVTGLLLNHTEDFQFDSQHVQSDWILDWYGIEAPEQLLTFPAGNRHITLMGEHLYMNRREIDGNYRRLLGAVLLDQVFGRECFLNEIIWAYDYGARTKKRWPPKHDNILVYVADPARYRFDAEAVERIPYLAPGLVGPEKAARGKLPTDTWWHTIVPTRGKERTGYPTQKPLGILRRIVQASSAKDDLVLDFFAGSGTIGEAAVRHGHSAVLIDSNPEAMKAMARRLGFAHPNFHGYDPDRARFDVDPEGAGGRAPAAPRGPAGASRDTL